MTPTDDQPGRTGTPRDESGDPACWLARVCPACGRLSEEDPPARCTRCGASLPED